MRSRRPLIGCLLAHVPHALEMGVPDPLWVLLRSRDGAVSVVDVDGGLLGVGLFKLGDPDPRHQGACVAVIFFELVIQLGEAVICAKNNVPAVGIFNAAVVGVGQRGFQPVAGETDQHREVLERTAGAADIAAIDGNRSAVFVVTIALTGDAVKAGAAHIAGVALVVVRGLDPVRRAGRAGDAYFIEDAGQIIGPVLSDVKGAGVNWGIGCDRHVMPAGGYGCVDSAVHVYRRSGEIVCSHGPARCIDGLRAVQIDDPFGGRNGADPKRNGLGARADIAAIHVIRIPVKVHGLGNLTVVLNRVQIRIGQGAVLGVGSRILIKVRCCAVTIGQVPDALIVGVPHSGRVLRGVFDAAVAVVHGNDRIPVMLEGRDPDPGHQGACVAVIFFDLVVKLGQAVSVLEEDVIAVGVLYFT